MAEPGRLEVTPPRPLRTSWGSLVDYYRCELSTTLAFNLAYRGAVAIWVLSVVVEPIVLIAVWRTVTGTGSTGSYTGPQFVAYYLVLMVVGHLTFIWHMYEFEFRIRTGAFSPLLLRPVHPVHHDVCQTLTYKLVGLVGLLPAAVVLAVVFGADFSGTDLRTVLAFLPALVLAMAVRFLVEWCLALAAFWLTKVSALNTLYASVFAFLAGQFAPLEVLPGWLQTAAAWTPFPWMLAFPVETLLGRRTGTDLLLGYAAQLVWVVIGVVALRLLWSRATRRYSAVGAWADRAGCCAPSWRWACSTSCSTAPTSPSPCSTRRSVWPPRSWACPSSTPTPRTCGAGASTRCWC